MQTIRPTVRTALDAGCGDVCSGPLVTQVWPDAYTVHMDRFPSRGVDVAADLVMLPVRPESLDLVLVRHPDVYLRPDQWADGLHSLAKSLRSDGVLLVTCYAYDEQAWLRSHWPVRTWESPGVSTSLAAAGLDGRDRLIAFGQH